MKNTILTLTIGITTACSSFAGPSWGVSLRDGTEFFWNSRNQSHHHEASRCMPLPRHSGGSHRPETTYVVGPQYYKMSGVPRGTTKIKNYTNAPIVVDHYNSGGRRESTVIPKSWD